LVPLLLFVHLPASRCSDGDPVAYGGAYFYFVLAVITSLWTTVGFERHSQPTLLFSSALSVATFTFGMLLHPWREHTLHTHTHTRTQYVPLLRGCTLHSFSCTLSLSLCLSVSLSLLVGCFQFSLWPCIALSVGVLLQRGVLCFLLATFRYSFSLGEVLLVSQGISLATLDVVWWTMRSTNKVGLRTCKRTRIHRHIELHTRTHTHTHTHTHIHTHTHT
jgi:hypothetical protein